MIEASFLCLAISFVSLGGIDDRYLMTAESTQTACEHAQVLVNSAYKYKIDPFILAAIAWNESRWTPSAFDGECCGIGQINPSFVPESCSQLKDPTVSLNRMAAILDGWRASRPKNVDDNIHIISCYAAGTVCTKSSKAVRHAKHILRLADVYRSSYWGFNYILPWRIVDEQIVAVF